MSAIPNEWGIPKREVIKTNIKPSDYSRLLQDYANSNRRAVNNRVFNPRSNLLAVPKKSFFPKALTGLGALLTPTAIGDSEIKFDNGFLSGPVSEWGFNSPQWKEIMSYVESLKSDNSDSPKYEKKTNLIDIFNLQNENLAKTSNRNDLTNAYKILLQGGGIASSVSSADKVALSNLMGVGSFLPALNSGSSIEPSSDIVLILAHIAENLSDINQNLAGINPNISFTPNVNVSPSPAPNVNVTPTFSPVFDNKVTSPEVVIKPTLNLGSIPSPNVNINNIVEPTAINNNINATLDITKPLDIKLPSEFLASSSFVSQALDVLKANDTQRLEFQKEDYEFQKTSVDIKDLDGNTVVNSSPREIIAVNAAAQARTFTDDNNFSQDDLPDDPDLDSDIFSNFGDLFKWRSQLDYQHGIINDL